MAAKRSGQIEMLPLDEALAAHPVREREMVALDDVQTLAKINPRQAKVAELRYFAGLGTEEAAQVLNTSTRTVERDWDFARAFPRREIER